MCEILFRGKRVDNGEWVEGGIIPLDVQSGYVFIVEPFLSASTLPVHEIIKHHAHLVVSETVGQYTGLNDNTKWEQLTKADQEEWLKNHTVEEWNGKKIFEGDIVVDDNYGDKGVVSFGRHEISCCGCCYGWHDTVGFYIKCDGVIYADEELWNRLTIIGNIHDNPNSELLRGENNA